MLPAQAPWLEALISKGNFPLARLCDARDTELALRATEGRRRVFKTHAPHRLAPCRDLWRSRAKVAERRGAGQRGAGQQSGAAKRGSRAG